MIKVISKKEYETMKEFIDKQNDQIDELIKLTADAQVQARYAMKRYGDLIKVIVANSQSLPPEVIESIREIGKPMGNEG